MAASEFACSALPRRAAPRHVTIVMPVLTSSCYSDEPMYEEEEDVFEDELDPEVPDDADDDFNRRGNDEEDNVVISGDPSANANNGQKGPAAHKSIKDKRIPNEERTTTPYMTKYEKARILGTRALQIRQENKGPR